MSEPTQTPPLPAAVQPIEYEPLNAQLQADVGHLRLLTIFHYIYGSLTLLFSSVFIFHIVFGVLLLKNPNMFPGAPGAASSGPPPFMAWMMIIMGSFAVIIGWTLGILTILSGRAIASRKSRMFSIVIAAINCLSVPFGTALGVFTMVVLLRDSVKTHYATAG